MDRRQLEENVKQSIEEGYNFEEIRQAMIEDGYSREMVDEILSEFKQSSQGSSGQSPKFTQPQNQNGRVQGSDQNQQRGQNPNSNPQSPSKSQELDQGASQSPGSNKNSGNNQPQRSNRTGSQDKNREAAAILSILVGAFGAHKFYLGDTRKGVLYLCFCWTGIPGIIGIVEGIKYLKASDRQFQKNYVEK